MIKPGYQQPIDAKTYASTIEQLEKILVVLHPFMPFLTEEIWQHITERSKEEALIIAKWPTIGAQNAELVSAFESATEVI